MPTDYAAPPGQNTDDTEETLLRYCRSMIRPEEVSDILQKVIRICEKQRRITEKALDACPCGSYGDEDVKRLVAFCQGLLTTSGSLNRVLYEFESASKTDLIAMVTGKYRKLNARVDPEERRRLYESIRIRKTAELVMVYLPYLPGRRQTSRQFIFDLLYQRLRDESPYPQWGKVHILFTHVYPSKLRTFPKDVDNFNYKPVIDFLSAALSFSDSAWTCSLEQRAEFRDDLATGVYIRVAPQDWHSGLDAWNTLPDV